MVRNPSRFLTMTKFLVTDSLDFLTLDKFMVRNSSRFLVMN